MRKFDIYACFLHVTCMPTKTISLTLEAYERLRRARRRPNESFSSVVMRARWADEPVEGAEYLRIVRERGPLYSADELKTVEEAKECGADIAIGVDVDLAAKGAGQDDPLQIGRFQAELGDQNVDGGPDVQLVWRLCPEPTILPNHFLSSLKPYVLFAPRT